MLDKIKEKVKIKKIIAIVIAVLVVAELVTVVVVSESFFDTEKFAQSEKADLVISQPLSSQEHISWLEAKGESINIIDTELSAVKVKNNSTSHSFMLIFHPLTEAPQDMASYAHHFYELGFNVIIPDYIGEESTMGFGEKDIVRKWISYITEQDNKANIFVLGVGVGGTAALLSTEGDVAENVKGVISDSAYCDLSEVFSENIKSVYGVSPFPAVQLSSIYTQMRKGWSFSQIDIKSVVKNSKVPILYIHGTEDSVVPVGQSNELYEVTRAEGTEHFTIHGAQHAQALNTNSEKYWRQVDEFIRNCM